MERKTGLEPATAALARQCSTTEPLPHMVPWGGIEPPTRGFSVPCSTDWATKAYLVIKFQFSHNHQQAPTTERFAFRYNFRHLFDFVSQGVTYELPRQNTKIVNSFGLTIFGDPDGARTHDLQRDRLAL